MKLFSLSTICALFCTAVFLTLSPSASAAPAGATTLELLQSGQYAAARTSLEKETRGHEDGVKLRALLEAMIQRHKGNVQQALVMLRTLVRDHPDFVPARRTLASTLARTGQSDRALFHAQYLLRQTTNQSQREETQAYIDRNAGPERGLSLRFSLKPSSNINNGSEDAVVTIGSKQFRGAAPESGIGVSLGATAWQRWHLTEDWNATLSGSVDGTFYDQVLDDEVTARVSLGFGRNWKRGYVSIAPTYERSFLAGDFHRQRLGVQLRGAWRLDAKRQISGRIAHWRQTHPEARDHFDGHRTNGELSFAYLLSRSSKLSLSIPFEFERTERARLDHNEVGLDITWDKNWKNGLTTGVTLGLSNNHFLGPFIDGGETRRDDTAKSIGLSLRHRKVKLGKFIPELRYTYTRTRSNIALYDYDKHEINLGIFRSF